MLWVVEKAESWKKSACVAGYGSGKLKSKEMFNIHRVLIAYAVGIPLALVLGYLVATPDLASVAALGFVVFCLALPLVIQWHHALLIAAWNSAFILGFMPGQPLLWLVLAGLAFALAAVNHVTGLKSFLRAPELTKPILFLLAVVVVTARFRGGWGSRVLGGSGYGGRGYIYLLGAILGYFALTAQRISIARSERTVKWFFLSGLTFALCNLAYALGPAFYVLYNFVSADYAESQAMGDWGLSVERFTGLGPVANGLLCFVLARWGIRRTFEWNKPWRLLLLTAAFVAGFFSGYRSEIGLLGIFLVVHFMVEGLWKTAFLPLFCLLGVLCLTPMLLFANKLPSSVQRSLAAFLVVLPLDINPEVRAEAANSSQWRYEMWREVVPEIPKYLLLGKGYSIDPVDLYLTEQATQAGLLNNYEVAIISGNYHNGPLSVLIPFGIFGAIAFFWVLGAGVKVLYRGYRYGDARLRQVNMCLLSFFLTQCIFFFFVFGAISSQLVVFLGILGFSVSLNGGVCRKPALAGPRAAEPTLVTSLAAA
jgi:hypothetical protein